MPDERDEAMRDLSRAREDAVRARLKARQQLKALLLRHGHRYTRQEFLDASARALSGRGQLRAARAGHRLCRISSGRARGA